MLQCEGTDPSAGSGLKSNQNLSNLPSFLGLWDLFWEKIVVSDGADGAFKCDVTLKLSRKTAVDIIAGRYDVVGYKRGNKPYKKFRDCGMIELTLKENIIQSELLDVATDVEQPVAVQDEKSKKKAARKSGAAAGHVAEEYREEQDEADDDDDDVSCVLEDMMDLVAAGCDDYAGGIAAQLVSGIIDAIEARTTGYADAMLGEYALVSQSNAAVAAAIDAIIVAVEEQQSLLAGGGRIERPMSSGVSVSLVMESLLQAVDNAGAALRPRVPRFRLEGPMIDLRSLPWEREAGAGARALPTRACATVEAQGQNERAHGQVRDITGDALQP